VGAWDAGPFDNDEAADFAQELDEADPNQRIILIREALQSVLDAETDEELESAEPRAVAAAAVLTANRVDPVPVDTAYAPKFLATDEQFEVSEELIELALLALDRVAESGTDWSELFREAETLDVLRDALIA
jgi:uncharacterized protein DUF4259